MQRGFINRERKEKLTSASSTAVDVLVGVLGQLKEVAQFVPVPYFELAVTGLYQTVITIKVCALRFLFLLKPLVLMPYLAYDAEQRRYCGARRTSQDVAGNRYRPP
jgi:hypothetical protein